MLNIDWSIDFVFRYLILMLLKWDFLKVELYYSNRASFPSFSPPRPTPARHHVQQKRHWCIEQYFGICGRGRGWDDLGEWPWNMYNIIYEMSRQTRFDARYWMLGAGALGWPRGMVLGGRREEGSGWGTRVYLWWMHVDIWQNQYNIVRLKN